MEKETFTIVLDDGAQIEGLEMNGNNFISAKKLTEKDFAGKLSEVTVKSESSTQKHGEMELVQITKTGAKYWFVLRDLTEEEIKTRDIQRQIEDANNAAAELSEIVATMMG